MAQSTCIKCSGTKFEMVEKEPAHSTFKYNFIQCAGCGGVVGVVEFFSAGTIAKEIAKTVGVPGY